MSGTPKPCRILLVEDDVGIGRLVERGLAAEGYEVDWVRDLMGATETVRASVPDLVILDRMLPDGDGAAFCAAFRRLGHSAPICMLTARDALEDKLRGFEAGADDYLTKPFEFDELLARLAALRRRAAPPPKLPLADEESRTLILGGARASFTPREWPLMRHLLTNAGQTVSREALMEIGWGDEPDVTDNAVDVYIGYLRRKLAKLGDGPKIETVRGVGFILVP